MPKPLTLYVVRYMLGDLSHTYTDTHGPWDYASNARTRRNALWKERAELARCWVEETFDGRTVQRYGALFKREAS